MINQITDASCGAKELLSYMDSADKILVGAGAGLSAAAGLSYMDREVFKKYFPDMVRLGYHYEYELVGMRDDEWTPGRKWAYWATHINYVRNIFPPAELYKKLLEILNGRDFFVVTSNCDRQFMRNGFPMERLFEFQGNYDNMGCSVPCTEKTWDNAKYLQHILKHINHETFECSERLCRAVRIAASLPKSASAVIIMPKSGKNTSALSIHAPISACALSSSASDTIRPASYAGRLKTSRIIFPIPAFSA